MSPAYTACGKQVLRDGADFCQARSPEAAILITIALGGRPPGSLEREAIATGLRAGAVLNTEVAAGVDGPLRKTFLDLASLMLKAAKELSNG